jgi:hypothetical protein
VNRTAFNQFVSASPGMQRREPLTPTASPGPWRKVSVQQGTVDSAVILGSSHPPTPEIPHRPQEIRDAEPMQQISKEKIQKAGHLGLLPQDRSPKNSPQIEKRSSPKQTFFNPRLAEMSMAATAKSTEINAQLDIIKFFWSGKVQKEDFEFIKNEMVPLLAPKDQQELAAALTTPSTRRIVTLENNSPKDSPKINGRGSQQPARITLKHEKNVGEMGDVLCNFLKITQNNEDRSSYKPEKSKQILNTVLNAIAQVKTKIEQRNVAELKELPKIKAENTTKNYKDLGKLVNVLNDEKLAAISDRLDNELYFEKISNQIRKFNTSSNEEILEKQKNELETSLKEPLEHISSDKQKKYLLINYYESFINGRKELTEPVKKKYINEFIADLNNNSSLTCNKIAQNASHILEKEQYGSLLLELGRASSQAEKFQVLAKCLSDPNSYSNTEIEKKDCFHDVLVLATAIKETDAKQADLDTLSNNGEKYFISKMTEGIVDLLSDTVAELEKNKEISKGDLEAFVAKNVTKYVQATLAAEDFNTLKDIAPQAACLQAKDFFADLSRQAIKEKLGPTLEHIKANAAEKKESLKLPVSGTFNPVDTLKKGSFTETDYNTIASYSLRLLTGYVNSHSKKFNFL